MTAKKAFTKGAEVTYLSDWDRKGTVTFRHAIVYACGRKQMVLTDAETGEEMGRHFAPVNASETTIEGTRSRTLPRLTDEEATELAKEIGALVVTKEAAHFTHCLANEGNHPGYDRVMRESLKKLHAPEGISYAEACRAARRSA